MHRCLQTSDVVFMIGRCLSQPPISVDFPYTKSDKEWATSKQALLSLSLASKSLLEPCLDALWGSMLSARPLLDILIPLEKRSMNDSEENESDGNYTSSCHKVMDLVQFLDHADMTRFYYYASRVKGLKVEPEDIGVLLSRALPSLSSTRAKLLLPNLRFLCWYDDELASLPCIGIFAGPNVTSIELRIEPWPEHASPLLYATFSSLRQACPLLEDVAVEQNWNDRETDFMDFQWQHALVYSVLSNITRAKFSFEPSCDTLMCLSKMPNLRTLQTRRDPCDASAWDITAPLDFPSLRHLEWAAYNFCEAAALLRGLHTGGRIREFESLTIRRDRGPFRPENSELDVLLDALRTTCSMQALSSLALWVGYNREPTIGAASSLLRALFSFGRIEALTIWGVPVEYDDAFLDVVSTAWPRLRVLRVHAQVPSQSKITPRGLLPLARQNRRLEELEVDVNSWPDEMLLLPATHGPADTERQRCVLYVDIRHIVAARDHSEVDLWFSRDARTHLIRRIFPMAYVHYKYELMNQ